MNVYKLNNEELNKYAQELNKTPFGIRASIFSLIPFVGFCLSLFFFIFFAVISSVPSIEENFVFAIYLSILATVLCFLTWCITQLQYGRYLKEFIESKKEK